MASRASAVLLVLLFVAFPAASAAAVPALPSGGHAAQTTPEAPVSENTTFTLQLRADGDAHWTITDTYALEDGNDTRAFEELAVEFTNNQTDLGWEQSFRDANRAAVRATGREMALTNVTRSYETTDRRGELVIEFTWANFATVDGNRLVVQDAFNTTAGTWFPRLYANQTLVISPPTGYGVTSAPPTEINIDDGAIRFDGPQTFEPGYLDIVYRGDQRPGGTDTPGPTNSGLPWFGVGIFLTIVLAVVAIYVNRQDDVPGVGAAETRSDDDGPSTPPSPTEPDSADGDDGEIDVTLLSDEERVERLLEANGGRMKQARIVKETGWSNAKVSQLLSSMDEADRIDKLRIGRENLISFPDEDVTDGEE